MVPLMATWHEAGLDAAIARVQQLDREAYDTRETFLRNAVFILQEAQRPAEAIEVLKLGEHVYPDAAWVSTDLARLCAQAGAGCTHPHRAPTPGCQWSCPLRGTMKYEKASTS
jgi:hypothetical protein